MRLAPSVLLLLTGCATDGALSIPTHQATQATEGAPLPAGPMALLCVALVVVVVFSLTKLYTRPGGTRKGPAFISRISK